MSQGSEGAQPGRIIIDSDWKEQVAQEKEKLRQEEASPHAAEAAGPGEIPEASFLMLVVALATQAMASLGQIPDPDGQARIDFEIAKHHIDMLGVVQQKTQGNLDAEESRYLESTLTQLRFAFVSTQKAIAEAQAQPHKPSKP